LHNLEVFLYATKVLKKIRTIMQGNMFRGTINVEGNCSAPGAPQNFTAVGVGGYPFPFSRTWIWSKKDSPSSLISSPNLALAHLLSPSLPALRRPGGPQEETRASARTTTTASSSSSASSTQIPTGPRTNPPDSQPSASPPGQSLREFVIKPRFFSAFCFRSPRPPFPF